ncbi:MAG: NF038130 family PEP-CTERM protein [Methylococcales bacterium]
MKISYIKHTPMMFAAMFAVSTTANALPTIVGTNGAAAVDYLQYKVVGPNSLGADQTNSVPLATILDGNAADPKGNVELFTSSESAAYNTPATWNAYTQTTSLVGDLGGASLKLSSLNASDWAADIGGGQTLLQKWTLDLFNQYLNLPGVNNAFNRDTVFAGFFLPNGGEQRFSDPNISYAYSQNGQIHIGLAGFLNASSLLAGVLPADLLLLLPTDLQLSELVKVEYNGNTSYLYGFNATDSHYKSNDNTDSFTGNYDLTLLDPLHSGDQLYSLGVTAAAIPEPTVISLLGIGLIGLAFSRKKQA